MDAPDTATLNSAEQVGIDLVPFQDLIDSFEPLKEAHEQRGDYVTAIREKAGLQGTDTAPNATGKDSARELMARSADALSQRAVPYALVKGNLELKQKLSLSYADVRYGEADEDVLAVRALVKTVRALPEDVRTKYWLTKELIDAPEAAAKDFEKADVDKTAAHGSTRLATLELPALFTGLRGQLTIMKQLTASLATQKDKRWKSLAKAFADANKRRKVLPKQQRDTSKPRIIQRFEVRLADGQPARLLRKVYGAAYTFTVENRSGHDLRLWLAQADGSPTTPQTCPAGQVTVLTRADMGPETATYLMGQFVGGGGEAGVLVRKVGE
ncbi:hypothetical protein Q5H93_20970 [Hymenobacter sp. ASUV-10]|uniref:Uncharacterized protein n=1 Tax=Hymenobacter aranciens TaxID=3063996 RepID=A0ABT9BG49_9BACT|nr:hypothetical protein [Hymenobacter sp. ASUV-10]MDO7877231.1 hypothetical protein [Hymenobacter sp. ASUV-10]